MPAICQKFFGYFHHFKYYFQFDEKQSLSISYTGRVQWLRVWRSHNLSRFRLARSWSRLVFCKQKGNELDTNISWFSLFNYMSTLGQSHLHFSQNIWRGKKFVKNIVSPNCSTVSADNNRFEKKVWKAHPVLTKNELCNMQVQVTKNEIIKSYTPKIELNRNDNNKENWGLEHLNTLHLTVHVWCHLVSCTVTKVMTKNYFQSPHQILMQLIIKNYWM